MNSCMWTCWLEMLNKEEDPGLCIIQENGVFHVLPESRQLPDESIKRMYSPGFSPQLKRSLELIESQYQRLTEHRWNQADKTEKDETRSCHSRKIKLQHEQEGDEKDIHGPIVPSAELEHNENEIGKEIGGVWFLPVESNKRMYSPGFSSQLKDRLRLVYFGRKELFEELGNSPASPPYDLPVRDHSQDCVAKVATTNEDLDYACPVNGRMRARDRENEQFNYPNQNTITASGTEHQNIVYEEHNINTNESHHHFAEATEIGYHSEMSHNKSGTHVAAIGFKDNNKRDGYEHKRYQPFSIHDENHTGILMETKYQCPRENREIQEDLKERGETQSETEFQEQEGDGEDIHGPIVPSADLKHNVFEIVVDNKDLDEIIRYLETAFLAKHNQKTTSNSKERGYRFRIEHGRNQAHLTGKDEMQSDQSRKTKLHHEQEGKEEVIYDVVIPSSDLEQNENANLKEVSKQEQKAGTNGDSVITIYGWVKLRYKKPTGVPKESRYQRLTEHRWNQADKTDKDETRSCHSRKIKLQHEQEGDEKDIHGPIVPSAELEHNENKIGEEIRRVFFFPYESIERMCLENFSAICLYKLYSEPLDFGLKESCEELGNPPASRRYDDPVRDHSQDCVAKAATCDEDLGYACPVNGRMRATDCEKERFNCPNQKNYHREWHRASKYRLRKLHLLQYTTKKRQATSRKKDTDFPLNTAGIKHT